MTSTARRFAAVAILAAGLLTSITPVHSHAAAVRPCPVQARGVRAAPALVFVIDTSASIVDTVIDGVSLASMIKTALGSALDRLSDGVTVGVLAFADSPHWFIPMHMLRGSADRAQDRRQIAKIYFDGDTYIYPALQATEKALVGVRSRDRRIILLTDGQGENANFDQLIHHMHREHMTLFTIGVTDNVARDELRRWAQLGGGHFYDVPHPRDIPRILVHATCYGTTA